MKVTAEPFMNQATSTVTAELQLVMYRLKSKVTAGTRTICWAEAAVTAGLRIIRHQATTVAIVGLQMARFSFTDVVNAGLQMDRCKEETAVTEGLQTGRT